MKTQLKRQRWIPVPVRLKSDNANNPLNSCKTVIKAEKFKLRRQKTRTNTGDFIAKGDILGCIDIQFIFNQVHGRSLEDYVLYFEYNSKPIFTFWRL